LPFAIITKSDSDLEQVDTDLVFKCFKTIQV
jgi:hypothetical protein